MTTTRQAICHDHGHDWSSWSLWAAVWPPSEPRFYPSGPKPVDVAYTKYRTRQCLRCGVKQSQDGGGTVRDLP